MTLIPSLLRDEPGSISSRIPIVRSVKLLTPDMDNMRETLKKDALDLLVQLGHPLVKIRIAFQVQPVNLETMLGLRYLDGNETTKLTAA